MKYNAKQMPDGKWAVFAGKKYFVNTVCDTENDAIIKACEMSAQWYQVEMDNCQKIWEETHRANGKVDHYDDNRTPETAMDFWNEWGNVLC